MKTQRKRMMRAILLMAAILPCGSVALARDELPIVSDLAGLTTGEPFDPSWESLEKYECPEWFRDAKLGIFVCWNLHSLQGMHDWYAHRMYLEGDAVYKHHVKTYGHPSKFGFKDFIPMWKAEKFDADDLVRQFKNAGAKYIVPIATYHDNFDCWNSKHHKWNSVNMGPKKDIKVSSRACPTMGPIRNSTTSITPRTASRAAPILRIPRKHGKINGRRASRTSATNTTPTCFTSTAGCLFPITTG